MQIVIDIEDTAYTRLVNSGYVSFNVINVVRQGTLLPKGYSRLIDADELKKNAYSASAFTQVVDVSDIDNAPTVLESTK